MWLNQVIKERLLSRRPGMNKYQTREDYEVIDTNQMHALSTVYPNFGNTLQIKTNVVYPVSPEVPGAGKRTS